MFVGCEVGQVGLVPRNGSNYSTVQLCVHDTVSRGEFRDVCGDRWGERETRVACNELGYSTTEGKVRNAVKKISQCKLEHAYNIV